LGWIEKKRGLLGMSFDEKGGSHSTTPRLSRKRFLSSQIKKGKKKKPCKGQDKSLISPPETVGKGGFTKKVNGGQIHR